MTSKMEQAELRAIVQKLRFHDLQMVLGYSNRTANKKDLQTEVFELLKRKPGLERKIKKLLISKTNTLRQEQAVAAIPNMNVQLKNLPFYDDLYVVIPPTILKEYPREEMQVKLLNFFLTACQSQDIVMSLNATGQYQCHILLRVFLADSESKQNDDFPPNIAVTVNNVITKMSNQKPINRARSKPLEEPINITSHIKLSPQDKNVIRILWKPVPGKLFAAAVFLSRRLQSCTLLERLKKKVGDPDLTKEIIRNLLQSQSEEFVMTSLRTSLLCPIKMTKMDLPCRSGTCTHLRCFDALAYLEINEQKAKWICPLCDKLATFETLTIDKYFEKVMADVPAGCTEVEFPKDASWTAIISNKESKKVKDASSTVIPNKESKKVKDASSIAIIPNKESKRVKRALNNHWGKSAKEVPFTNFPDLDSEDVWLYGSDLPNRHPLHSTNEFGSLPPIASEIQNASHTLPGVMCQGNNSFVPATTIHGPLSSIISKVQNASDTPNIHLDASSFSCDLGLISAPLPGPTDTCYFTSISSGLEGQNSVNGNKTNKKQQANPSIDIITLD